MFYKKKLSQLSYNRLKAAPVVVCAGVTTPVTTCRRLSQLSHFRPVCCDNIRQVVTLLSHRLSQQKHGLLCLPAFNQSVLIPLC